MHLALLKIAALRSGLEMFLSQNLILMGVFFAIPLYLQLVQGLDALDTGIKMLPVSITMFITSMAGSALAARFAPRRIIRVGLLVLVVAIGLLLTNIKPDLDSCPFAIAMGLLGVGMGLMASQFGNVAQSSVGDNDRGEAGGLQYTSQQLGSALGVALIGAVVLTGLTSTFVQKIDDDPRVSEDLEQAVSVEVANGVSFVSSDAVRQAAEDHGRRRRLDRCLGGGLRGLAAGGPQGGPADRGLRGGRRPLLHRRAAESPPRARRAPPSRRSTRRDGQLDQPHGHDRDVGAQHVKVTARTAEWRRCPRPHRRRDRSIRVAALHR